MDSTTTGVTELRQEIIDLIIETANELGEDEIGGLDGLNEDTVLFGKDGALDSMVYGLSQSSEQLL